MVHKTLPRLPMGELTTIMARDGHEFQAWLTAPSGRPRGAVVVIQEIFGVNGHIRALTDGFAAAGYTAIAPSLFDRVRRGIELGYTKADMQEGAGYRQQIAAETALKDVAAAVALGPHRRRRLLLGRIARLPRGLRAAAQGRGGLLRPRG
jgi:dienelactone hydrolase